SALHDKIFGYDEAVENWTYELFLSHVIPEERSQVDQRLREALGELKEWEFEYRIRRHGDNSIRCVLTKGRYWRQNGEKPTHLVGRLEGITARKKASRKLGVSLLSFRGTFGGAPIGIAHVDRHGYWIRVNQRLCTILGYEV